MNSDYMDNKDIFEDDWISLDACDLKAVDNEAVWNTLIEQIRKRNVIPVIGGDIMKIGDRTISEVLASKIATQMFNIKDHIRSFNELICHPLCTKPELLKGVVAKLVDSLPEKYKVSSLIKELLEIKYFNFVITTSFDPIVENTMWNIHKGNLRVLGFYNSPENNQDISSLYDTNTPTLYYMFGKACSDKDFVLSDSDLLRFTRSWLLPLDSSDKAKPKNLSLTLANKYLLVLGNNWQEWFFRFFWYALKDEYLLDGKGKHMGMETLEKTNENIIEFLNNSNITPKVTDLKSFITELKDRLAIVESKDNEISRFEVPQMNYDVFISYSRADEDIVKKLYDALTNKGVKVWYDRNCLGLGDEFMNEIRNAIRTCKLFTPVLSKNIINQADKEHIYRLEWHWAVEHKMLISSAVHYLVPFADNRLDLDDKVADIPEAFKRHNVYTYDVDMPDAGIGTYVENILTLLSEK